MVFAYPERPCDASNDFTRPQEEPVEKVVPRWSLLGRLRARRRVRHLELMRQARSRQLALRVEEILVGCGLSQADYSIGGGRCVHIPEVVSVVAGPPVGLDIRLLPGQTPDDFAVHASVIAFHLGVAEVRVIPLPPSLVRLELLRFTSKIRGVGRGGPTDRDRPVSPLGVPAVHYANADLRGRDLSMMDSTKTDLSGADLSGAVLPRTLQCATPVRR
ncbi:MAG TPA: pentapeptide repeat-containing protein [Pseudonocardiaceae bacterium]|nr:pentapeptide repeat-containing protein [Pseudonocardiaceae bacterium]